MSKEYWINGINCHQDTEPSDPFYSTVVDEHPSKSITFLDPEGHKYFIHVVEVSALTALQAKLKLAVEAMEDHSCNMGDDLIGQALKQIGKVGVVDGQD